MYDSIVIGGGQAGLAAGYHLQRRGLKFTILEANSDAIGSWGHYYQSLKLFSPARYSSLPGMRFPGDPSRYPSRDEVIAYFQHYRAHFNLPVITSTRVEQITQSNGIFHLTTNNGEFQARSLIAATGAFNRPYLPELPGQAAFGGEILHSSAYFEPTPLKDKRVIVVGAGNSAVQIAVELAQSADVTLTSREPIAFRQQRPWGLDIHFWITITGYDTFSLPAFLRQPQVNDSVNANPQILDTGVYQAALAAGKPAWQPMFSQFTPDGVVWADGRAEQVDAVIFATGYRPNVPYLASTGALDAEQRPIHLNGISAIVPGLYYVGLSFQRSHASATIRGVGADANYVIKHLQHYLKHAPILSTPKAQIAVNS